VAGTKDAVMMVEANAKQVPEEQILEAIMFGHEGIKKIVALIEDFRTEALALAGQRKNSGGSIRGSQ
jgi:polyribonucleotide nucleotidyltransferase